MGLKEYQQFHFIVRILICYCLLPFLLGCVEPKLDNSYGTRLWYNSPSVNWNEALPIGNGALGAMIFGGVRNERISLNEETLWSGAPKDWNNPQAKEYLPSVRKAALSGHYKEADSLSKFMQGPWTQSYMPMADLLIQYNALDSANYIRDLDLDSAIAHVSFEDKDIKYQRSLFSSYPDHAIVIHHTASEKSSISFNSQLISKLWNKVEVIDNNHIVLIGKSPKHVEPAYRWQVPIHEAVKYAENKEGEGMNFEVHMMVMHQGGKIEATKQGIKLENADEATIILSAATSFNGFNKSPGLEGKNPSIDAQKTLKLASSKSYEELKDRHIKDYQPIFRRVKIYLGESKKTDLPTNGRLKLMAETVDPELVSMISQFGRYILIAGSRPGGQPVNLKGIWNERLRPEYSSNWCIDHDAQMFYYPVETNNLSEMHWPFLQLIEELAINGKETAKINYGMNGWCAHHNTDIWRMSSPVGDFGEGNPHWATWNMSGPWLCSHLYDHYLFTGNKEFLKKNAWPVMKGAAEFCLDWLIEDPNGLLVSVPSVSPENTFITNSGDTAQISVNATSDIALIKELFKNCINTMEILSIDEAFSNQLKSALNKLAPYPIGSTGQLLEWSQEWRAVDPSHRHLSHMYPVYPGSEISPIHTPELSDAAKLALSLKEKTNCSWGFSWKAGCWARLHEADSAWNTLNFQLQYVDPKSKSSFNNYGLYPNLFNSDGKDLIMNGNGCATAVLTEMIVQSHAGEIHLLPALPTVFQEGSYHGICARGGFDIDVSWNDHILSSALIVSKLGNDCSLRTNQPVSVSDGDQEIEFKKKGEGLVIFETEVNKKYFISPL